MHVEVILAAGYAAFLLCVAGGLDLLARRSHARSERYRTAGFTYHPTHDAWICPEEQVLTRSETDHELRLVRYRGRPQICNHCPAKTDCTDSDEGREVVRAMDPWPHSEAGRFHRGISLAVALVAGLILAPRPSATTPPRAGRSRRPHSRSSPWRPGASTRPSERPRPTSRFPVPRHRHPSLKGRCVRATRRVSRRGVEPGTGGRRLGRARPDTLANARQQTRQNWSGRIRTLPIHSWRVRGLLHGRARRRTARP